MGSGCSESRLLVLLLVLTLLTRQTGRLTAGFRVESVTSVRERLELARQILTEVPLIDGHNDLPWNIRKFVHNQLREFNFATDLRSVVPWSKSPWSHTDLLRLRRGMVGGQFWAAYVPCESQHLNAVQLTLEQIDLIKRLIDKYWDQLQFATSASEILEAHTHNRIASLIGVEGGHSIGNSLAVLRILYDLGVRYMTLTHTCNTPWAISSSAEQTIKYSEQGGLTQFGKFYSAAEPVASPKLDEVLSYLPSTSKDIKLIIHYPSLLRKFNRGIPSTAPVEHLKDAVVREMNRLGMMVDLSHASVLTMKDALEVSVAPVIFSHSSAFALCNSSRNVPDDILQSLALNGGLVMVTFYNYFVKCGPSATVADVAEHISYIRSLIGVEHIGVGGDFDGINRTPRGLEDVSMYPELFAELIRTGHWTTADLKQVAGLNLLRVFTKVEQVRDEMRSAGVMPSEQLLTAEQSPCAFDVNLAEREAES